jgi:hypothetical protein
MNVADTRREMLACATALRERLRSESGVTERSALVEAARKRIERLRKQFKRTIDERASRRFGFALNEREGVEEKLAAATIEALELLEQTARDTVESLTRKTPGGSSTRA